jgi:hypothetical protein
MNDLLTAMVALEVTKEIIRIIDIPKLEGFYLDAYNKFKKQIDDDISDARSFDDSEEYMNDFIQTRNDELDNVEGFLLWCQDRKVTLIPKIIE